MLNAAYSSNELHCSMVHGKWSNCSHSYYTPKIAFVKSYDAFFFLFLFIKIQ